MGTVPIKESVFNTGADDSVRVTDVYNGEEISIGFSSKTNPEKAKREAEEKAKAAEEAKLTETPYTPPGIGDASVVPYGMMGHTGVGKAQPIVPTGATPAEAIANAPANTSAGAIVATGASEDQLKKAAGDDIPKEVDTIDYLKGLYDESMADIKDAKKALKENLNPYDYNLLITADLKTFTDQILKFIDYLGLNGLFCPGEKTTGPHVGDAVKSAKNLINIRKHMGCNKGVPEMDFGMDMSINAGLAMEEAMVYAGDQGATSVINDTLGKHGNKLPDGVSDKIGKSLLSGFEKKGSDSETENAEKGDSLLGSLDKLKPGWDKFWRGDKEVSDTTAMAGASDDAKDTLKTNERTDVMAMISENLPKLKEPASRLAGSKYPKLQKYFT